MFWRYDARLQAVFKTLPHFGTADAGIFLSRFRLP